MRDLAIRAVVAFFKDRLKYSRIAHAPIWPHYQNSGRFRYNARDYFVLRGPQYEVLAVYRIRPSNGCLRRIFNYPVALTQAPRPGDLMYYEKK
jgi:hypothetical protein